MDTIIQVQHLKKRFKQLEVLHDINFDIHKGEVVTIIGSSGSGKSTLLRCINLLERLDDGHILYHNQDILDRHFNVNQYRSKVGMVFQGFNLFNNLTVLENCMIGQIKVLKRNKEEAKQMAFKYLEKVGMSAFANKSSVQLSGGQKQRVAIARAFCMSPEVLLFDEPTSALDPISTLKIEELLMELKEKYTIAIVTHNMQQASRIADYTAFFLVGEMVEYGETKDVFSMPKDKRTEDYITGRFG